MAHRCRLLRRPCFLRRRRTPRATVEPSSTPSPTPAPISPPQTRRRTRLAARPKSPCPQVLRKKKGPKKRLVVVVWKRVTRVLRRESKRGVPAGFALIVPHGHVHRPCELELELDPESEPESAETTVAATFETGSGWSLV